MLSNYYYLFHFHKIEFQPLIQIIKVIDGFAVATFRYF